MRDDKSTLENRPLCGSVLCVFELCDVWRFLCWKPGSQFNTQFDIVREEAKQNGRISSKCMEFPHSNQHEGDFLCGWADFVSTAIHLRQIAALIPRDCHWRRRKVFWVWIGFRWSAPRWTSNHELESPIWMTNCAGFSLANRPNQISK